MIYFWWVAGGSLLAAVTCLFTNNRCVMVLSATMEYLKEQAKTELLTYNKPTEARFITTDQLPLLQIWYDEQLNYGLFNIIGVLVSAVFMFYGGFFHHLPYIIIGLSGLFLGVNIFFLPKAITRLLKVLEILMNYKLMIKMLEVENKTRDPNDGDTGKQSAA